MRYLGSVGGERTALCDGFCARSVRARGKIRGRMRAHARVGPERSRSAGSVLPQRSVPDRLVPGRAPQKRITRVQNREDDAGSAAARVLRRLQALFVLSLRDRGRARGRHDAFEPLGDGSDLRLHSGHVDLRRYPRRIDRDDRVARFRLRPWEKRRVSCVPETILERTRFGHSSTTKSVSECRVCTIMCSGEAGALTVSPQV